MTALTAVPSAFWTTVPWWAIVAVLLVVSALSTPFAVQLARGRTSSYSTREHALSDRADVLEKVRQQALADARAAETTARADLTRERAEWAKRIKELEDNRDLGWDLGRGMEDIAHNVRHEHRGLVQRFNSSASCSAILRPA